MKKLLTMLCICLLLCSQLTVQAATPNQLTHANKYTYSATGAGNYSVVIPYTGNYEITISSAEGGHYGSGSGGSGSVKTQTVRLTKDSVVFASLGSPGNTVMQGSTCVVTRGGTSVVTVDNTQILSVKGGVGTININTAGNWITGFVLQGDTQGSASVHWHSGNGKSGATHANVFGTVYGVTNPAGCYVPTKHVHNSYGASCPACVHYHQAVYESCNGTMVNMGHSQSADGSWHTESKCNVCGHQVPGDEGGGRCGRSIKVRDAYYEHDFDCNNSPTNVWDLGCGFAQGQICSIVPATDTQGLVKSTFASATFKIQLCDTEQLHYGSVAHSVSYLNTVAELVTKDDYVVYYKRR